ncbi:Troponin C skeletal muscle [Paragonimus skrjabini miyazakii]|uniref:Troponin C skeletal muscle n=1 Tax=Paragonimus skrjabini miyazakii TaxID=59628 RepID=A0A8S9Z0L0_9TREM|nr:Troponin C skeletal muscle [Paragonimus skrjabini miyazakii]
MEIRKLYDSLTSARSRKVPLTQICKTLQLLGQCPTQATIKTIFDAYTPQDQPENVAPTVDLEAFTDILNEYSSSRDERFAQLNEAFLYFDKQESGVIESEALREKLLTVGDCLNEKEANEFFKEANPGTDGKLPYDAFVLRLVDAFPRPQSKRSSGRQSVKKGRSKK